MANNTTQCPRPGLKQALLNTDIGHTNHEMMHHASTYQVCIKQLISQAS